MDCVIITIILAMLDWLSHKWLMTQIQSPCMEFKLVITLIHENNGPLRHDVDGGNNNSN